MLAAERFAFGKGLLLPHRAGEADHAYVTDHREGSIQAIGLPLSFKPQCVTEVEPTIFMISPHKVNWSSNRIQVPCAIQHLQLVRPTIRQQPRPMQKVPAKDHRIRFDLITELHQCFIKHRTLMQVGGDEEARHGEGRRIVGNERGKGDESSPLQNHAISIIRFFFGLPALTNSTSAAMTLYSGHMVSASQPWPVTLFTMASGKWKVV